MPAINKIYQRVRFVGEPNLHPGLANRKLGDMLAIPESSKRRVMRELAIVPLEECDFLVERFFTDQGNGVFVEEEDRRIPLGFAMSLEICPRLFGLLGVRVRGGYHREQEMPPEVPKVYEIISRELPGKILFPRKIGPIRYSA